MGFSIYVGGIMIDKEEYIKDAVESWIDEDIKELTSYCLIYNAHLETGELISLITKIAIDISPFMNYISECYLSYASKRPEYNEKYIDYLKNNFSIALERDYYLFRNAIYSDYKFSKETLDWVKESDDVRHFKNDLGTIYVAW